MFELKTLSPEAVPRALAKAERYRLLNEPGEAVSICLDALEIDPTNQEAIATLLLAITEQFEADMSRVNDAWQAVARITDGYERTYYTGIIFERRAKAFLRPATPARGRRPLLRPRRRSEAPRTAGTVRPVTARSWKASIWPRVSPATGSIARGVGRRPTRSCSSCDACRRSRRRRREISATTPTRASS